MIRHKCLVAVCLYALLGGTSTLHATVAYNLNVQVIQVCEDAGTNCTNLGPSGGTDRGYLYETQVNEIWEQAGVGITFLPIVQWNNTEALRLTSAEVASVYGNTFTSTSGDPLPGLASNALQIFFVQDHSGTGYDGSAGSGWVGTPLSDPTSSARNAGNAQLYIDGTSASNGRSVMANEGFASDKLSGTLAHEIGHLLGLRHVEDVNDHDHGGGPHDHAAGTVQDPEFTVASDEANLMWGAGYGPAYENSLTLQQNFFLNAAQRTAAIYNGTRLDPTGNGIAVMQAVPEPSAAVFLMLIVVLRTAKRRWDRN